jgi:hypothetical protein
MAEAALRAGEESATRRADYMDWLEDVLMQATGMERYQVVNAYKAHREKLRREAEEQEREAALTDERREKMMVPVTNNIKQQMEASDSGAFKVKEKR